MSAGTKKRRQTGYSGSRTQGASGHEHFKAPKVVDARRNMTVKFTVEAPDADYRSVYDDGSTCLDALQSDLMHALQIGAEQMSLDVDVLAVSIRLGIVHQYTAPPEM